MNRKAEKINYEIQLLHIFTHCKIAIIKHNNLYVLFSHLAITGNIHTYTTKSRNKAICYYMHML